MRDYVTLRDMGINVDDSIQLTKIIRQDNINFSHKQVL